MLEKRDKMTAIDALKIIQEKYPDMFIRGCLDFPDFYAFALCPVENEPFGGGLHTVSKSDGSLSTFNLTQDLELFMAAKRINIKKYLK